MPILPADHVPGPPRTQTPAQSLLEAAPTPGFSGCALSMAEVLAGGHATALISSPGTVVWRWRQWLERGWPCHFQADPLPCPTHALRTLHPGVPGSLSLVPQLAPLETPGGSGAGRGGHWKATWDVALTRPCSESLCDPGPQFPRLYNGSLVVESLVFQTVPESRVGGGQPGPRDSAPPVSEVGLALMRGASWMRGPCACIPPCVLPRL